MIAENNTPNIEILKLKVLILEYKETIEENKSKNKKLKNDLWKKWINNKVENLIYD